MTVHPSVLVVLAFCLAGVSWAGTITSSPSAQSVEIGIQAGELELQHLGFDPSVFFFFTANTAYEYNGTYEVEIIAAALDPAGASSLQGVVTHAITFVIDDSGNIANMSGVEVPAPPAVPEPSTTALALAGLAAVVACVRHRRVLLQSLQPALARF